MGRRFEREQFSISCCVKEEGSLVFFVPILTTCQEFIVLNCCVLNALFRFV